MAVLQDCSPCYDGEPDYDPNEGTAILDSTSVSRARIGGGIGGGVMNLTVDSTQFTADTILITADQTYIKVVGIFARSKLLFGGDEFQGRLCNSLSLQIISVDNSVPPDGIIDQYDMIVLFQGVEVERYVTTLQPEDCGDLIAGPEPQVIIGDNGAIADLRTQVNANSNFISMPVRGYDILDQGVDPVCLDDEGPTLLEGAIGPSADRYLTVRTGPQRSILHTSSREIDDTGAIGSPEDSNLIQWNFDQEYWTPYASNADCRPDGTACA